MKKILLFALILLIIVSLLGCTSGGNGSRLNNEGQQKDEIEEKVIINLVKDFGEKLQMVSLQAPKDIVEKSMRENYGDYVSEVLLEKWISDPLNAPGRLTSSPWPDRIETLSIEKLSEYEYEVKGEIIEITSTEEAGSGIAIKRPLTLLIRESENRWLITDVTLGAYEETNSIVYNNVEYGFNFSLPDSWEDYVIFTDEWEGFALGSSQNNETGPLIYIRHPQWTLQNKRQDIPIMIFTLAQWNSLRKEEFHIGAAPISPSEMGRNDEYVFALPARYNYAFPAGYEEVEKILQGNPLQPNNSYAEEKQRMDLYISVMKAAFQEENGGNAFIAVKLDTLEGLSGRAKEEILRELTSLSPNVFSFEDVKNDSTKFEIADDGSLIRSIDGSLLWVGVKEYDKGKAVITGVSWFGNLGAVFPKYEATFENGMWQLKLISMAIS